MEVAGGNDQDTASGVAPAPAAVPVPLERPTDAMIVLRGCIIRDCLGPAIRVGATGPLPPMLEPADELQGTHDNQGTAESPSSSSSSSSSVVVLPHVAVELRVEGTAMSRCGAGRAVSVEGPPVLSHSTGAGSLPHEQAGPVLDPRWMVRARVGPWRWEMPPSRDPDGAPLRWVGPEGEEVKGASHGGAWSEVATTEEPAAPA